MSDTLKKLLDSARRFTEKGSEYWHARELQIILGYAKWANFMTVIEKARDGCETLGIESEHHFADTGKMVKIGSGAAVMKQDMFLSRYACYLVAMNGDSTKPEVAFAQTYFAVQTLRQEAFDQLPEDEKRLQIRDRVRRSNKALAGAAKAAGVTRYDIFTDAGYRGMYDAPLASVKAMKGIDSNEDLLDCVGRVELAANEFRITQTEEKLKNDRIRGQALAENAHREVGRKVRKTMMEISKTPPERLPRAENIKKVAARKRKALRSAQKALKGLTSNERRKT